MQMCEAAGCFLRRQPQALEVGTDDQGSGLLMTRTSAKKATEGSSLKALCSVMLLGPISLSLALLSTLTGHLLHVQASSQDANSSVAHTLQAPSSQASASLVPTGHSAYP